jgi:hypothetical protein
LPTHIFGRFYKPSKILRFFVVNQVFNENFDFLGIENFLSNFLKENLDVSFSMVGELNFDFSWSRKNL